ncbi:MAG: folate-binding protein [Acidobacteriaceae bacterium]|jgi:aminomethyltransferase
MSAAIQSAQSLQPAPLAAAAQLAALLRAAAIAPLDDIGWLRVTGPDRLRWLNGMVTNSIAQLAPGEGCYNFALNAQGHIQADLTAFLHEDSILLETSRDQIEKLLAHLNRFIIMDEVELADITAQRSGLLVAGPDAGRLLAAIVLSSAPLAPLQLTHLTWRAAAVDLLHAHSPLVPKFEIWTDSSTFDSIAHELRNAGALEVDSAALEDLRILEGTPRVGTDIRDKDLPQETGQTRALHFTKGCYLGQEIVERIHSRGGVHRAFSGLALTGVLPAPGTQLEAEAKPVGELTSVASIHLPDQPVPMQLALGIIRREALENARTRNLTLTYPGGTATPIALPYAVP